MSPPETSISALLPVHAGVDARHLRSCVASLLEQTMVPTEVVVVEDGPLSSGQLGLLDQLEDRHPRVVRVRLTVNGGAGVANQAGLEAAGEAWIAKVDADDISLPERIATQHAVVVTTGVDVCGSAMLEFADGTDDVVSLRRMPSSHDRIAARMRWNNPINHPTAFYRRDLALAAGGYPPWRNMQDYGLFARMYAHGARMMNLDEALVLFRASPGVARRRRSVTIRRLEPALQRELRDLRVISTPQMVTNIVWRSGFRMLPPAAVRLVSRRLLANPVGTARRRSVREQPGMP